jgi:hypothetical protein
VPDEFSAGELGRRLDRIEGLLLRLVSQDVYSRDQREAERRFTELERDMAEERQTRKDEVKALRDQFQQTGTNWRQAIYAGVIPGVLFLVGVLLQLKGGGK